MSVTGVETVNMNNTENYSTGKSTLGKNDFLNLFVTQEKPGPAEPHGQFCIYSATGPVQFIGTTK